MSEMLKTELILIKAVKLKNFRTYHFLFIVQLFVRALQWLNIFFRKQKSTWGICPNKESKSICSFNPLQCPLQKTFYKTVYVQICISNNQYFYYLARYALKLKPDTGSEKPKSFYVGMTIIRK